MHMMSCTVVQGQHLDHIRSSLCCPRLKLRAGRRPEVGRLCKQRSKLGQMSWDCQEQLFRQEVENADDVRLSYSLMRSCQADIQKFCRDVTPGAPCSAVTAGRPVLH